MYWAEAKIDDGKCLAEFITNIIATPLSTYKEIILSIKDSLKKNVILTDTGSVKREAMKIVHNINLTDVNWIPSHPIAGTEESGPKAGQAEMFENRWCIISPPENCREQPIKKLKTFLKNYYPVFFHQVLLK